MAEVVHNQNFEAVEAADPADLESLEDLHSFHYLGFEAMFVRMGS